MTYWVTFYGSFKLSRRLNNAERKKFEEFVKDVRKVVKMMMINIQTNIILGQLIMVDYLYTQKIII